MCGSGVRTGMTAMRKAHRIIQQGLRVGLAACAVAAAGTTTQGTAAHPLATATGRRMATAVSGSAWSSLSNIRFDFVSMTSKLKIKRLKEKKKEAQRKKEKRSA